MSQSSQFGRIWIYSKSPFTNDYANAIVFNSKTEIDNFFDTSSLLTQIAYYDNCSWIKREGVIRVSGNEPKYETATYMRFENEEGRMIYAFIMDTIYNNEDCTSIIFEVDVWNTYQLELLENKITGFVEQSTLPNYVLDENGNRKRYYVTNAQGINTGNKQSTDVIELGLDVDWLIFVMKPTARMNVDDERVGLFGFPASFKSFRYFACPCDLTTGKTLPYRFAGNTVKSVSIDELVSSFTNIFVDGNINTVNQAVNVYTTKHCGFNYTYDYGVVEISDANLTGVIRSISGNSEAISNGGTTGGITAGWLDGSVNYTGGSLTYNGATLSADFIERLILWCRNFKLWPEAILAQMWYESNWGTSSVAISDNNWSGITAWWTSGTQVNTSVEITMEIGSARPAGEGGNYVYFRSSLDWLAYHCWLVGPERYGNGQVVYLCSEKTSVRGYGEGLFKQYGANADYAATAADTYISTLVSIAGNIRTAVGDSVIDEINGLVYNYNSNSTITGDNITSMLNVLASQIGYLEKASNRDLDDPTANPGSGNFVKYWNWWYDSGYSPKGNYQGEPWCAVFISWAAQQIGMSTSAFVYEISCPRMIAEYQRRGMWYTTPQPGDVALRQGHTGIVESISGNTVVTIEGNTGSPQGVYRKNTNLSDWEGFGRPNYGNADSDTIWTSNVANEQNKGLEILNGLLGTPVGNGECYAVAALYSGYLNGPGLGCSTGFPLEPKYPHSDTVSAKNIPWAYDWQAYGWTMVEGPVTFDVVKPGDIVCWWDNRPGYSSSKPYGHTAVVYSVDASNNNIGVYEQYAGQALHQREYLWSDSACSGIIHQPGYDTSYNTSGYTGDTLNSNINSAAVLEVIRMSNLYTRQLEIGDLYMYIDRALKTILNESDYESQLLTGEFTTVKMFDVYGNFYDFFPEYLPEAIGGTYLEDGDNNSTYSYLPGAHTIEITGSLGDSNHVHYTVQDYNIFPDVETILNHDADEVVAFRKNKFNYGISDSNPRSITILSDQVETFMQSQKNQYEAQMKSFNENKNLLAEQIDLNNAQTAQASREATYNSDYAIQQGLWNGVGNLVGAGAGIVGGIMGGSYGIGNAVSGIASLPFTVQSTFANQANLERQGEFVEQNNSLRSQSNALTNIQAKQALNQSIRSYNASIKDLDNQPTSIQQLGTDLAFQVGNRADDIYILIQVPVKLQLQNANNYIKAYGTVQNRFYEDIREILGNRQRFNFTKCANIELPSIEINQSHLNTLKSIFLSGVRLWNYSNDIDTVFGDTTIDNPDR